MLKGLFILGADSYRKIYGPEERAEIDKLVDIYAPPQTPQSIQENPELLKDVEVILSGWGAPKLDGAFLDAAPKLKAMFYGAGSIRGFTTDEMWDRGIIVTSSYAANAVPVAEFCVSQIIFSLKLGWRHALEIKRTQQWKRVPMPGAYGSTVGLVSLGMIGRMTLDRLRAYDLKLAVYSTSMTPEKAEEQNVRLCSLDEIFEISDVVSLHTPNLPETRGMIQGSHFERMKQDATFINTARGAVVNEPEMIAVLQKRPDLTALLDVTFPEPPKEGSPLYTLPNVILTPHIAGSMDNECRRMGRYALEQLRCYLEGKPMEWQISRELAERLA